jgi:putative tryptophan/tyrosine transport system substrate-binding protein
LARAQQPAMPVIGFLRSTSLADATPIVSAFSQGLRETGFIEGQNVAIEYRSAEGRVDRLPALVADLIGRPAAVIVDNTPSALAAKDATRTIPIVFVTGSDPVRDGFVTRLNRPEGNVTGVSFVGATLGAKQMELLLELVPRATTFAVLVDVNNPVSGAALRDVRAAAQALRQKLIVLNISGEHDLDAAFATLAQQGADALLVVGGGFLLGMRNQIVAQAARHALPAIYNLREYVAAGGLMSYSGSITDAYRLAGVYAARILKGEKPVDLPVQQAAKVELTINLKVAKKLGVSFPISLLARADEVIE